MASRIVVGLAVLLALHEGLIAGMVLDGMVVGLLLVILGLLHAHLSVDAEDATGYLAVTIAVGAAAGMNVLSSIPAVGATLDAILDPVSTVLYAGVVTILVKRTKARIGW